MKSYKANFKLPIYIPYFSSIYITGGFDIHSMLYSREAACFLIHDLTRIEILAKSDMAVAKNRHKLIALNSNVLYSLCGRTKDEKLLNISEKYDIGADKWSQGPSLNEMKQS